LIEYLKDIGCAFQGNLGSFLGLYGSQAQKTANDLKKWKYIRISAPTSIPEPE